MKHIHLIALAAAVAATSCGSAVRQGRSPVYLTVNTLLAMPGGPEGTLTGSLQSNLRSCAPGAAPCPAPPDDFAQAVIGSAMKDVTSPSAPTTNNAVTITQYHVEYVRPDGRNTQGVDVPYAFDGGVTGTIPPNSTQTFTFELVRVVAKQESPLAQLSTGTLDMVANITFYGHDEAGNQVSVTGSIQIIFGNFGS